MMFGDEEAKLSLAREGGQSKRVDVEAEKKYVVGFFCFCFVLMCLLDFLFLQFYIFDN